jgi:hypothetical protein
MWLLRRKASAPEAVAEVLAPAPAPVRRIEITVDRQWIARISRRVSEAEASEHEREQGSTSPRLPDG